MDKPLVSVVIPTYNSEKTIGACLRSVKEQTYPNIEIIVVDNYSKDRTREVSENYADWVLLKGRERSAQVNFGVRHARGKYVYEVGSDFILEPTVVEEAVRKCEVEGFDAICIHNTSDPSVSFWAKVRKLERDCYADDELNVAARFCRKEVFEIIGGFDEELVAAEDYDFHNRLLKAGFKIGRIKAKEIHIGEPKTLWEIARKHYYYGKTLPRFLEKNRGRGMMQLSPLRPAFIRNWKKFAKNPIVTAGFLTYQFVKYLSAGLGFLSRMIDE
ncbi:MAG: glycosyltransferase [Candidatus Brockarchaeota archaeon]|nr:glycosyltransferase [Candidatus Brockarchaeota archaeon]